MESRIHGDVYVRFGGERLETYRPKGRQGALRLACGGGKTLIMCCGAYEKKRLGLANKPMIIGLKANIHEIARTFCTAYPMAKVLYPGKEDFTPRKRERIFREIRNNDWDAVILSHEQFGMIPQSPEIQQEILQAELDCVEENLEVLKAQPLIFDDSFVLYDDERLRTVLKWLPSAYSGQILVFTCHEREMRVLKAEGAAVHEVRL